MKIYKKTALYKDNLEDSISSYLCDMIIRQCLNILLMVEILKDYQ